MPSTGSIARNFHEGTRSEYLAQYIFSAFGTAIPVPHPEDSGIDLHCSLGRTVGKMLHVENYYSVQIKSTEEDIDYEGEEPIKWLLSHQYPLLFCVISKRENRVKIFHSLFTSLLFQKRGINKITLQFQQQKNNRFFVETQELVEVKLGLPILDFDASQMASDEWRSSAATILRDWIELDQSIIDQRKSGGIIFTVPNNYHTNQRFTSEQMIGFSNFADNENNSDLYEKLYANLGILAFQAARHNNTKVFETIETFAKSFLETEPFRRGNGLTALTISLQAGAKYLGRQPIEIMDSTGVTISPKEDLSLLSLAR